MYHAGGARQRAHERPRAAGMIQVHVGEEQEIHTVGEICNFSSAASISGTAVFGPVSTMAARPSDTTMCDASICGRTYSVSTAVMPSANVVSRGMTALMGCGNIAA
jgi:hypothetical protein